MAGIVVMARRFLLVTGVFIAAALTPVAAQAVVFFEYASTCTESCSEVGLGVGDAVSGMLAFADAAVLPGADLSEADVVDFSFDFGTVHVEFPAPAGFILDVTLNATADGFTFFVMRGGNATDPATGDGFSVNVFEWTASENASCSAGCSVLTASDIAQGPPGSFTRVSEIPEPAALLLTPIAAWLVWPRRARRIS